MTILCDACQTSEAVYHITIAVTVFGPRAERLKQAQFWLCESCELASRQILARDELQRSRLAFRFVDNPSFMSPTARWRRCLPPAQAG
jgi:hypothetical protein